MGENCLRNASLMAKHLNFLTRFYHFLCNPPESAFTTLGSHLKKKKVYNFLTEFMSCTLLFYKELLFLER